jgi:hypothetical protein
MKPPDVSPFRELLTFTVRWVVPLLIFAYIFVFALRVIRATRGHANRLSARAGLLVGLASWVYVVYRFPPTTFTPETTASLTVGGAIFDIAVSLALGYSFIYIIERLAVTRVVGVIVLVMTATSCIAGYSYFFMSDFRDALFNGALFLGIGAGLHIVLRPVHVLEKIRDAPSS